ncbi:MAG: type I glutamate--ammonia ligase [Gammaproteobacteria bacterium]
MSEALIHKTLETLQTHNVKFVDLRFTDTRGKEQHVSVPVEVADADFFAEGKMFDGSSIAGWKNIANSDMILRPDLNAIPFVDPFFEEATLVVRCDIVEPHDMSYYDRDPRNIARRAEEYLKSTGIADTCYLGPEPEFFIFDNVQWKVDMEQAFFKLDSHEAAWNSGTHYDHGNIGHRPRVKGGYFPVPPVDSSQDIRSAISLTLQDLGFKVETHHHEVATGNQNEINFRFSSLLAKADEMQVFKYVVHNVAHTYGKTATFMPKPIAGDNGSGMHCNQSLAKDGKNLFYGDQYAGLSEMALFYIGGIIKHARALNAFTNPTTNSYKRLVPGFEAPVLLAYSAHNRSASIRIPYVHNPKARRIEVRFPDPLANPYLAFAAMLMAGLDGIKNRIHPGEHTDKDLYHLEGEELDKVPTVCCSLEQALEALKADQAFLLEGGVFSEDMLKAYIGLKMEEVTQMRMAPHPLEFDLYYSG